MSSHGKEQRSKRSRRSHSGMSRILDIGPCEPSGGKLGYRTHADAKEALKRIQRAVGQRCEQRVYKCEHAEHYHLTSKPYMPEKNFPHVSIPTSRPGIERVLEACRREDA